MNIPLSIGPTPHTEIALALQDDLQREDKGIDVHAVETTTAVVFQLLRQGKETGWTMVASMDGHFVVQHTQTETLKALSLDVGHDPIGGKDLLVRWLQRGYI
jgi:hypothetical protein